MAEVETDGFRYVRRVQFHETDQAGVAHFSSFFKYMEEAEHALWRAAGLSIDRAGAEVGWPRIIAQCDYKRPLFFEDEFEVIVRVVDVTRRTIQYGFVLKRGEITIARGSITTASVRKRAGSFKSVEVPDEIERKLRAAAVRSRRSSNQRDIRSGSAIRSATRDRDSRQKRASPS